MRRVNGSKLSPSFAIVLKDSHVIYPLRGCGQAYEAPRFAGQIQLYHQQNSLHAALLADTLHAALLAEARP